MKVLEGRVGGAAMAAALRRPVINLSDALYRLGATEVGKSAGIEIAFMRPDLDALDILGEGNLYWVGNSWNTHTQDLLQGALNDYFNEGMTREQLIRRFADDFAGLSERGIRYWELLADHTATRTREMGRVTGYERAQIKYVQVRAHLDTRTTDICKQMHGRVIAVSHLKSQRDNYLSAVATRDEFAAKAAWNMHGKGADLNNTPSNKLPKDTASPPYHFRCRTITVMYTQPTSTLGKLTQKVVDRKSLNKQDKRYIMSRAKRAAFLRDKRARAKFKKHRVNIPTKKLKDYEADARALIADPKAKLLVSTRVPLSKAKRPEATLHAVFAKPARSRDKKKKKPGQLISVVEMDEGVIVSHHWRDNTSSKEDVTPTRPITKSLLQWLIR